MNTKYNSSSMMKMMVLFSVYLLFGGIARAQLLSVTPLFPNDAANITITADCSKGNQGLFNYANPNDVYVHVGVITNLSANGGDWRYVKFTDFTTPNPAAKATSLGSNKYQYVINNPRTFFGVPAGETIKKIAILFRNGNGTVVQRNSDGSDMYINIYDGSLAGKFTQPLFEPRYIPIPEPISKNVGDNLPVTYESSQSVALKIYYNGSVVNSGASITTLSTTLSVATSGNQQVVGEANNGTTTVRDTFNFYVAPPVNIAPLPAGVRDGINYETGDTSAILVLRAPGKTRVTVIGDFNNWTEQISYQMNRTPDGKFFWLRITGLTPAAEYAYQYFVDGTLKIADPYTEKILDPSNDGAIPATTYPNLKPYPTGKTTGIVSVLQTKETPYVWLNNFTRPDKHSLVIYELLVRDFVDNHDWKTLKDSIAYLKNLGITAIEVMPFNEFEGNNSWGYNPDFYFAPDKYYGNKNSLKAFIDECHKNGIAVLMDIALNHSFGSSPMVQLYFDAANNRPSIDNPWFNPVQKHAFNVGYDMNHESLDTKYYFDRITEFWLKEYHLDGFRFDLSKGFTQKQTCDNNGNNCDVGAWGLYDSSRVKIWKNYYDSIQTYSANSYVILEHFADNSEEKDLSSYGMMLWGNMNGAFNEATMGYLGGSDFSGGISIVRGWSQPSLVTYMESHDEERLMYKNINFGNASGVYNIKNLNTGLKRNEMAAAFCFMIPGPKMIWQFGELGYDYSINYCQNGTTNTNCRLDPKPIKWDYLQVTNRKRLYEVYAALLKLRTHPLYKAGFVTNRVDQSLTGAFKWLKLTTDSSNILVVGNFDVNDASGSVTFQNAGTWYDYLTGETITATGGAQNISLQAGQYHVYVNRNVTNVITTPVFDIPGTSSKLKINVYPNPINTSSQVSIEMPASGSLRIEVANALGQTQSIYNAGYRAKGVYQFSVNDITQNFPVSTKGIYFLKVVFNGNVHTIKMMAAK